MRNSGSDGNTLGFGYAMGIGAYSFWGLSPLYWIFLKTVPAFELLVYRVSISLLFSLLFLFGPERKTFFASMKNVRILATASVAALFLGINWGVYLFAVNSGYLQDASLGYYINPLVSVFLGVTVLKERLRVTDKIAIALAFVGVLILGLQIGRFPWISFVLAFSFGLYGMIKKKLNLSPTLSLGLELAVIVPICLLIYGLLGAAGKVEVWSVPPGLIPVLIFTGPVTLFPLILFGKAAGYLPLKTVGFLQYIAPSLMLIISVTVFSESFDMRKLPGFIMVWTALTVYTSGSFLWVEKRSESTYQE